MSFRPPRNSAHARRSEMVVSGFEQEIIGEKAASLGRTAKLMERSLADLRAHPPGTPGYQTKLKSAGQRVYAYFVQRELCGFRDHGEVIDYYAIPRTVLLRLGAL